MVRYLILLLFFVSISCYSANSVLTSRDKAKIARNEKKIVAGEVYLKESDNYLKLIENSSKSGRAHKRDSVRLTNKHVRTRLHSFTYLKEGYKGLYRAYASASKDYNKLEMNPTVTNLLESAATSHSKGRKNFRKVPDQEDKHKAVKSMNAAIEFEQTAISKLKEAVALLEGDATGSSNSVSPALPVVALSVDSVATLSATNIVAPPIAPVTTVAPVVPAVVPVAIVAPAVIKDSTTTVSSEIISHDDATTFFSIQINASKARLEPAQLATYYSGKYKIVLTEADGYFRYSVGKFLSVEDAKKVIEKEKIKGYIVGYLNNSRVSVAEVTKALTK